MSFGVERASARLSALRSHNERLSHPQQQLPIDGEEVNGKLRLNVGVYGIHPAILNVIADEVAERVLRKLDERKMQERDEHTGPQQEIPAGAKVWSPL